MSVSEKDQEFREGYAAFENGIALDQNPYREGSEQADAWQMGWNQAISDAD